VNSIAKARKRLVEIGYKEKPYILSLADIWILTCEGELVMGPCWKELLSVFYAANPEKLPKNG
jgi:hypothetical protein